MEFLPERPFYPTPLLQVVKFFAPTPVANGEEGVHFTTNRRGITFTLATAYLVTVTDTPTALWCSSVLMGGS